MNRRADRLKSLMLLRFGFLVWPRVETVPWFAWWVYFEGLLHLEYSHHYLPQALLRSPNLELRLE